MKNFIPFLFIVISVSCFSQSKKEKRKALEEATRLYNSEMASWYGTDLFTEKFTDKHSKAHGYFSYTENGKATCVFFSEEPQKKILASFAFDSTYNVNTAVIDGKERDMTPLESNLFEIRTAALREYARDTAFFKDYEKMNPNFIPLADELGKRVYILTGPQESGIVVFGNDYLLTFSDNNKLKEKKQLHANIIPIQGRRPEGEWVATMHSHVKSTGDLITATDMCTLMLYCKFTNWKQHYVMSPNNVSIWECGKGLVVVMTRKAWDKISPIGKSTNKENKN